MNRKALLDTLDMVRPALASENLVPIFTNFCFTNKTVFAYKDNLGIVAPCDVDETFAVVGKTFIELLSAASGNDVELELNKENLLITVGKSKMKMPYHGKDEFIFEEPEDEQWEIMLDIDPHMLKALELCLVTSSTDSTMPAFMGVTVKGGKGVNLYSCDGDALSRHKLSDKATPDVQLTLPNEFCDAVIKIAEKSGNRHGQLYINGEWAVAEMGNNFKVVGRISENPDPLNFENQIKKAVKAEPTFVDIPEGLQPALTRARVVADPEGKPTTLTMEGGTLKVDTETHLGNVSDKIKVKGHPDVTANIFARLVQRALNVCTEFSLHENCTLYRKGEDFLLVVANYEG